MTAAKTRLLASAAALGLAACASTGGGEPPAAAVPAPAPAAAFDAAAVLSQGSSALARLAEAVPMTTFAGVDPATPAPAPRLALLAHEETSPHTASIGAGAFPEVAAAMTLPKLSYRTEPVALTAQLSNAGFVERADGEGFLHTLSGMQCDFVHELTMSGEAGSQSVNLDLARVTAFREDGTDVACDYRNAGGTVVLTTFASRWADVTLDQHFEQAVGLMTKDVPFGAVASVPVIGTERPESSGIEGDTKVAAFTTPPLGPQGQVFLTTLYLNKAGPWHVKTRATHTPPDQVMQLMAGLLHAISLGEVDAAGRGLSNGLEV